MARKVPVAAWHMLSKGEDFIDLHLKRLGMRARTGAEIRRMEPSTGMQPIRYTRCCKVITFMPDM